MVTFTANSLTANSFGLTSSSPTANARATKELNGNSASPANRRDAANSEQNPGAQRDSAKVFGDNDTSPQQRVPATVDALEANANLSATQFANAALLPGANAPSQTPSTEELQLAQLVIFDQAGNRATDAFNLVSRGLNDDRGGLIDVYA